MTGEQAPPEPELRRARPERARTKGVDRLLDQLRSANELAGEWLKAVEAIEESGQELSFTEQGPRLPCSCSTTARSRTCSAPSTS
jgi:hypothetical protein